MSRYRADYHVLLEKAAKRDFERAPRFTLEPAAEAERCRAAAALHWYMGRRDEAAELADLSVKWHRAARSTQLGQALLLRAELRAATGDPEEALGDLDEALSFFEPEAEWQRKRCLDLWVRVLVLRNDKAEIVSTLPDVRELVAELGDAGAMPRLSWLEGHGSRRPETLWRAAAAGFAELGEDAWVARTAFDLLAHRFTDGASSVDVALASELATALGTLAEDPESLAVAGALRQAVASGKVTEDVFEEAADVLDWLEWDGRARQALRFAL